MPGINIHLAAANVYLRHHREENVSDFIQGAIAPDFAQDTDASHFAPPYDGRPLLEYLPVKVGLKEAFCHIPATSSYNRGYLFHLITDYEFYTHYFDDDEVRNFTLDEFRNKLYHDYNILNERMKNKYEVMYPENIAECDVSSEGELELLSEERIDEFIEKIGGIEKTDNDYIGMI